jgi:hypothetical protein
MIGTWHARITVGNKVLNVRTTNVDLIFELAENPMATKGDLYDSVAWYDFTCPRCGRPPKEFCSLWPAWHRWFPNNIFFQRLNRRCHDERLTLAVLKVEKEIDAIQTDDFPFAAAPHRVQGSFREWWDKRPRWSRMV